jgi:Bacterial Ig-like domain (group 1)
MSRATNPPIVALLVFLAACTGDELNLPSEGDPEVIEVLAGNDQAGEVGGSLPESLVVRVRDAHDRPVAGQWIEFVPTADPTGQVLPDTALTDDAGRAASRWQLGIDAGIQQVRAQVAGTPSVAVTFTATADPAPPDSLVEMNGNNQFGQIGTTLPESLVVRLIDQYANPIAGAVVHWSSPTRGGSLSNSSVTTDSNGRVAVQWTLGWVPGAQQVNASYAGAGGSPVTFIAAATIGPAP